MSSDLAYILYSFLPMRISICLILLGSVISLLSNAQDNYEIQVYASPTVGKDTTMVELHSNYSFIGNPASGGVVSTNHMLRETIETTHGFTPWFEVGFYIFNAIADMGRTNYVGSHIRPRVMAPLSWNWPVGASISFEGAHIMTLSFPRSESLSA